jgi:hypothetical protein
MQTIIIIVFWLYSIIILSLSSFISYYLFYDLFYDLKHFIMYLVLSISYFLIPYPKKYHCRISDNVLNRLLP